MNKQQQTLTARVDAIETTLARIEALILAQQTAKAPVARAPKAAKVTQPKAAPKASAKPKASLCKANREAFIAKAPWAKGLSTLAIATEIVEGRRKAPAGFQIGEAYTRKVLTGSF